MHKNFIDGLWCEGHTVRDNLNPSDLTEQVGLYAQGTDHDTQRAITAATAAQPLWQAAGPRRRAEALDLIGSEILARREELGRLLAREEGKVLTEAIGEVVRAGHIFKFFAGEALRVSGEHLDSVRPGIEVDVLRQPVGVVGIITPWNFPIAIPAWKIAPALAYGNAVVFKPADLMMGRGSVIGPVADKAPFGLSAGICITSLKYATHFKRHVQSGMVMVNTPTAGVDYHVPFGGTKASSHGPREQGRHAIDFFTTVKTAYTQA